MNIQAQVTGLIIIALLWIFYISQKKLNLYREKIFSIILSVSTINLLLDIASIVFINYSDYLPHVLVELVCKTYIYTIIFVSWSAFVYNLAEVLSTKSHRKLLRLSTILVILEGVVVYLLPIEYYHDGNVVYTYGASVLTVYICSLLFIVLTLISTIYYFKKSSIRRSFAIFIWLTIWCLLAVIQFFFNQFLLVGFAEALGALILYIVLENPDSIVDRNYGCFNNYAFNEYVNYLINEDKTFYCCELYSKKLDLVDLKDIVSRPLILKEILAINKFKAVKLFRFSENVFISVSTDPNELENSRIKAMNILNEFDYIKDELFTTTVEHAERLLSSNNIIKFLGRTKNRFYDKDIHHQTCSSAMIYSYMEEDLISDEIDKAINDNRIEIFLQPIYKCNDKRFATCEALARIRRVDGSLLSPGIFIPISEQTGQIVKIGRMVFEKVCEFIKNNDLDLLGVEHIGVNLSVVQCEQTDLADSLIAIINKYQINPKYINLEITETGSYGDKTILLNNMNKLIEHGFVFSLDDFGKGESNLDYVIEMPVSVIKIDYELSKLFFANRRARHVVRAMIEMAHSLSLDIVVEGIEAKDELDAMKRENIDFVQGYYFSKPLPVKDYLEFIKKSNNN